MARQNPPKKTRQLTGSEIDRLDAVKRLAIQAMFADDVLMDHFALKGGAALDLIYRVSARASVDVDLSMPSDFPFASSEALARLTRALTSVFSEHALTVFDVTLVPKPPHVSEDFASFWGGYQLTFKIIEEDKYRHYCHDIEGLRRNAMQLGRKGRLIVDLSQHEFCQGKVAHDLDGYRVYVYSPQMIVAEKLRAICQQTDVYAELLKSSLTPRSRDFVDIYVVVSTCGIDMTTQENIYLLKNVFGAKRVPWYLLGQIELSRQFHRSDFQSILATFKPQYRLLPYDEYFDYVSRLGKQIEALGNE